MASPLSGVRSKRRHHNDQAGRMSRKTTLKERKKKGLSMRLNHKLTSNKNNNNPLPRITQKRLTKKSGFCIKGALMTSPRSRGIRDLQKPKKNSSDFDLLSLLEAAKNKDLNPKDMPHTTSACTTPATDSSCSLVDSYLEENRKPVYFREDKGNYFTNEENIKKRKESHSSTENNMFLPGNHWGGNNQRVFMPKETCRNEFSNTHDGSQCFGSLSFKSYESDTNQLPERRTPQSGQRLCSLSSYQKFAVGIVEALVSEKKKQFPSHDWLCNAEKDLQNIYHKTHNIALSNEQKSFDEIYQIQSKMSHGHIIETTNKKVSENIDKVKKTMYHRDNDEDINIGQSDKQRHEEKVFREMVVEAWVKAIPDDNKTEDHKKISTARCIDNPQHVSHAVHKGEFLEKIKKNLCGIKSSNVATQNTEPTLHVGGVCDDGYSPYPPPPTDLNSHNPGYKFVGSKTTWKNKQKSFHPLETGCNFEWNAIKHQHQQRLQSSWIPWFMGKRADNTCGDNKSPSFSPRFSLESLPLKYNCVDKGADIKECVDFHKKQGNHIPPVWSRCPKLQKLDKNEARMRVQFSQLRL